MTMSSPGKKLYTVLIVPLIIFLVLPIFAGSYLLHIMIFIFFYAYLSQCWNILSGYTGQFSLGHAAFLGVGAYTSSFLFSQYSLTPWVGMFIGALVSLCVGLFIGHICFRFGLKGAFFALATMAFAEILRILFLNLPSMGGAQGLLLPLRGNAPLLYQFEGKAPFYYIALIMMLVSVAVAYAIERSKTGFYFKAIHQNEESAEALGVDTKKYKVIAVGLSAAMTAFGGTFFAQYFMYIQPDNTYSTFVSFDIMLRSIIGGMGTVPGPVIGSFILTPLAEITRSFLGGKSGAHLMIYGLILMAVCIFLPQGVYPGIKKWLTRFQSE